MAGKSKSSTARDTDRALGRFAGEHSGPLLVVCCAIHGNEPAGLEAVQRVLAKLREHQPSFRGELVAFVGNRTALKLKQRFVDQDMNRIWSSARLQGLRLQGPSQDNAEEGEQRTLLAELNELLADGRSALFLDLHTSSAGGDPFTIISDTLAARTLAQGLPIPIILGMEEMLDGTLSEFLADSGQTALALEGGQHDDPETVDRLEAALWVLLAKAGCLNADSLPEIRTHFKQLKDSARGNAGIIEALHRHHIEPSDGFVMKPGFRNFSKVKHGQLLANEVEGLIESPQDGILLLPLYQGLGEDGFFLGREIRRSWLRLSACLRRIGFEAFLTWLPGISAETPGGEPLPPRTLCVDQSRITSMECGWRAWCLHLFGYRRLRPLSEDPTDKHGRWAISTRRLQGLDG